MRDFAEQLAEALAVERSVFDAERLTATLHRQRTPQDIEADRQALTKGVDACARLLFAAHWHRGDFVERYGEDELPPLIEGLNWQMGLFSRRLEELNNA